MIEPFAVYRDRNAFHLNTIVNDLSVRPWIAPGASPLDFSQLVADERNILLTTGTGGALVFVSMGSGRFEVHTQFIEASRGKSALQATNDALRWMFCRTEAIEIVTRVPSRNKPALGLVRAIHGELRFSRRNAWEAADGMDDVGYYALPIDVWAAHSAAAKTTGGLFHDKLEAAEIALGAQSPVHDDDEAHDHYVGATVEMILIGQVAKGVEFYNRWAQLAGYATVSVIATNPVVLDIGDALIAVRENDFDVLLVR